MGSALSRRIAFLLASLSPILLFFFSLPSLAASSLAAWYLSREGVLQLRTSRNSRLEAFYQPAGNGKGARVWIDFKGELVRPRSLQGSGPVREIRLGKPSPGFTRFVIEFQPYVVLEPEKLKLIGTSPDRWKLTFKNLPQNGFRSIGEGDLNPRPFDKRNRDLLTSFSPTPRSISGLPNVSRGKYLVVIDPGHGGPDPGAVGIGGLRETDIVLDISLQLAKLLQAKGVNVRLTRRSEIDLDLPPRVAIANRLRANAFVSIHANASSRNWEDVNGIETFFFTGFRGNQLARMIQQQVLDVSPRSPNRGVRKGRFFVIRRTIMPAVLVETGFVTGRLDAPRLANSTHRRKLAFAIATGILKYLQGAS